MPQAIQIQNPRALLVPDLQRMLRRAIASVDCIAPHGFDSVAEDLYRYVTDPDMFMFVGMEDGASRAVLLGNFPCSNLFPYPTLALIYNEGSKETQVLLASTMAKYVLSRGYSKMWAINGSKATDAVWSRCLTPKGWNTGKVGSVMELRVQ